MGWTTKTLRPLGHKVLVRLDEQVTRYGMGILEIPDYWREQQVLATVVSVGPGLVEAGGWRRKSELRPGDRVLAGKYNGTELDPPDDDPDARGLYWVLECKQLFSASGGRTADALREADVYALVVE